MDKTYNPHEIEQKWYSHWESNHYFKPSGKGDPYCIMIPPPNVTGYLHMGHGFQHSLMDALVRYHRMLGNDTLWQVGTDHAGIATQMVVERQLNEKNKTRHDLGREPFIQKIWEWKNHSGNAITEQIRRLGDSVDWSRERFTMDEGLSKSVIEVFVKLYQENLIYRGQRLVNWDPVLLTAISDLEVVVVETQGKLWHLRYAIEGSNDSLIVATTRPETMLGDTAVAVHPEDPRYLAFIGKHIRLPLTNRLIPIIADEYVDQAFGSGCVKITPAHDFNDNQIAKRHDLPLINIFTPDAKINHNAPEQYRGLDRFVARVKILEDLTALGLVDKIEDHTLKIPRGDRTDAVIEPYLTDQWFVKMESLAKPALAAVENGHIKFVPDNWTKTYNQWLENIQDWCISRQLWWGHRIPAWYDDKNQIYVGRTEAEVRKTHQLPLSTKLRQDEDVLDTWFSSALWPFSTLGWPEKTSELRRFYPGNVLVTGFDIIFFWVARMIMFGLKFTGQVPFKEVYITGLIRDAEGQKMSKSKGNILDPIDLIDGIELEPLIEKRTTGLMQPQLKSKIIQATRKQFPDGIPTFGTDALRFTFCALATPGREIRFDIGRLSGYRNFCNKIWNAARYVLQNVESAEVDFSKPKNYSAADQWINSQLQLSIKQSHEYFKSYRFDLLTQSLYEFTWNEFCDWYLEFSKAVLYDTNAKAEDINGTRYMLITILENVLKLLHPIMPFITEEIWQRVSKLLGNNNKTIMLEPYPTYVAEHYDPALMTEMNWVKQVITTLRNMRGEMNVNPSKQITVILNKGTELDNQYLTKHQALIQKLVKVSSISWHSDNQTLPTVATALVGELEILVPLAELIDKSVEIARLQKEIAQISKDLDKAVNKLANQSFVSNAPENIVIQEQTRVKDMQFALEKYQVQLEKILAMT